MSSTVRTAIQVVLAIVIVVLGYVLYQTITEPYKQFQVVQAETDAVRERMSRVRQGLIYYERREDRFPGSLDSLVTFLQTDSAAVARRDSIFQLQAGQTLPMDSLIYSPRTGNRFQYSLNDTSDVAVYLLQDPDSEDRIGSAEPQIGALNVASWE